MIGSGTHSVQAGGASWIKRLAKLTDEVIEYNDDFYRARLQALQAVDELVEGVVIRLERAGILESTFIFYTTDNGYHISQHRLNPGKECGFEEDINIPLIVRGPGVPIGELKVVTAHTDLAPTFLQLAGAKWGWDGVDGTSIPLKKNGILKMRINRDRSMSILSFVDEAFLKGSTGFHWMVAKLVSLPKLRYKIF